MVGEDGLLNMHHSLGSPLLFCSLSFLSFPEFRVG